MMIYFPFFLQSHLLTLTFSLLCLAAALFKECSWAPGCSWDIFDGQDTEKGQFSILVSYPKLQGTYAFSRASII